MIDFESINFRILYHKFLLVRNLDVKTFKALLSSGIEVSEDDNAMLLYGYIDHEAGMSFELLCSAQVKDDGTVFFGKPSNDISFKFRYGSFQGDIEGFDDIKQLEPFDKRVRIINDGYECDEQVALIRVIEELDSSRAPGYPDDILVYFIKEGYQNEGIWCRVEDADLEKGIIKMIMLNQPYSPFGKNIGDMVDVVLCRTEEGELKAVALLDEE